MMNRRDRRSLNRRRNKRGAGDGAGKASDSYMSGDAALQQAMEELRPALVNTALAIDDVEESEALLKDLITYGFFTLYGQETGEVEARLAFAEADLQAIDDLIADASKTMRDEPRWYLANPKHQDRTDDVPKAVPFREWALRHKIEYLILWGGLPTMLVASFLSAQAALLASGLSVYLDTPVLTAAVASIPGFGALLLKTMGGSFESERGKKGFSFLIQFLAVVALGTWGWTFSDSFHNTAGGSLDIFSDKPVWKEKLLVGAQIGFEFFAGTAIYLRIDRISRLYDFDCHRQNLNHVEASETKGAETKARVAARENVIHLLGLTKCQESALGLQVTMALAALRAKRARGSEPTL